MVERSTLEAMLQQLSAATCPEEAFGILIGSAEAQREALNTLYRRLVHSCHPDLAGPADQSLAAETFNLLKAWKGGAEYKINHGSYGNRAAPHAPPPPYTPAELLVRKKRVRLESLLGEGAFSTVHAASVEGLTGAAPFVKIARDPADNDLLEREYAVLQSFQQPSDLPEIEQFLQKQRAYVPRPVDGFSVEGTGGAKHRASLFTVPAGRCFTASTLRTEKFPSGIEPRHVYWIFRRLLLTLWMGHLNGCVHGAVTPDHVLVYPEAHGIVLLDWTAAARVGEEHVPVYDPAYEAFLPPELLKKELAAPGADLYMAAATAIYMLGGDPATRTVPTTIPYRIAASLLLCLDRSPRRRRQDAQQYHADFGRLLESILGPRRYAEMTVP